MMRLCNWLALSLVFSLWLMGLSFDSVRMFCLADYPAHDGHSYTQMAHGNYNVTPHHKYRILIPGVVHGLRILLPQNSLAVADMDKYLFYLVNLALGGMMLALVYRTLLNETAERWLALAVTLMLGGGRFIGQSVAQPMIDMGMYLSLAALTYWIATRQWGLLCLGLPFMALSKEVLYPVLIVPAFLVPSSRRLALGSSYVVAAALVWGVRHWISAISSVGFASVIDPSWSYQSNSMFEVIYKCGISSGVNLVYLLSARGLFDLVIAFGPLWIGIGWALVHRATWKMNWVWLLLPYALACGLLSRHWGRMLTLAFPWAAILAVRGFSFIRVSACGRSCPTPGASPAD